MGSNGRVQVTLVSPHPTEATVIRWSLPAHVRTGHTSGGGGGGDDHDNDTKEVVLCLHPRLAEALHVEDGERVEATIHDFSSSFKTTHSLPIQRKARMAADVLLPDLVALGVAADEAVLKGSSGGETTISIPTTPMFYSGDVPKERRGAARLYFDGVSRDSPTGPCGYGFHIVKGTYSARGDELVQGYGYAGMDKSSNEMEYYGLCEGLTWACRLDLRQLHVFGVSETIIKQLTGEYTIKNRRLKILYDKVRTLLERNAGMKCNYQRIHREENEIAEQLSNLGIATKETNITCHWPNVNHLMAREASSST